ncbi:MAG TPA: hypothetical protein VEA59_04010 [Patescibacteria group bacterium]|nr:hypothetical protein [Patescibacteria group bacterium]
MTKKNLTGKISAGVLAAAAAAAGTYLFTGKDAEKRRAAIAKMASDAKKDLIKGAKKAEKLSSAAYTQIEKQILDQYKELEKADFKTIKNEVMSEWKKFVKAAKQKAAPKKKVKPTKKAIRKTPKKTPKKKTKK